MNWYKKANLWDDIQKYGPSNSKIDINDPAEEERIRHIQETFDYDREKAIRFLNDGSSFNDFLRRDYFAKNYGWSVPNKLAIKEIKDFIESDNVLEIASGRGMWAKLMQEAGISVTPTDMLKTQHYMSYNTFKGNTFTNIEDLAPSEAIRKYSSHNVLMMSWPPYDDPMAYNALKLFGGNKLIFVGESEGGATADNNFFKELKNNWQFLKDVDIPRWFGIYDSLSFWIRK